MRTPIAPTILTDAELDAAHWRRHRWARLAVALAAPPLALLAPDHRSVLIGAAFLIYLPVALLIARRPNQPQALSVVWWTALVADCAGLAVLLAFVPGAEPAAFLGFLLVVVVNETVFGVRAGITTAIVAAATATVAHLRMVDDNVLKFGTDLAVFALVVGLVTHIVGRQAEELRAHRARLAETLSDLRRVDELRSRLVSTLAHDVRSPLGSIQGSLQTVLHRRAQLDAETQVELLEGAERQAARLLRLAAELLDLARLEEGRLELEIRTVPLRDVVDHALSYADPEGRIEVSVDPRVCVDVDVERVEQIVVNLATNTLRHGMSPFEVAASCTDGWAEMTFRDEGPGVPEDKIGSLFEPFRRGDTAGSVGLGLWIVRMLTEAHGGRVAYESNRPTGACFRVVLPSAECDGRA